ncbi:MAG TPA: TIGR02452 family protein, partial [Burkholderiales bacterium]
MSSFTRQIDRTLAAQYGREAVAIGERGKYRTAGGRTVDISGIVAAAVRGTASYPPDVPVADASPGAHHTAIEIRNETTLSAVKRLIERGCNTVLLNFASPTSPGGGFLSGARAQEEYLARSSCLYQCIRSNPMYAYHRAKRDPLDTDYA